MRQRLWLRIIVLLFVSLSGRFAAAADLDWSGWERLPVFYEGRRMPLDTFAREMVESVCGRSTRLFPPGDLAPGATKKDLDAARSLFPDGKMKWFRSSELLFSWLAEPERWECVDFLPAEHEGLRKDLLGLPMFDDRGGRLKHVSPAVVKRAIDADSPFRARLAEIFSRRRGREALVGVEKKAKELYDAYSTFRALTFRPGPAFEINDAFESAFHEIFVAWPELSRELKMLTSDAKPNPAIADLSAKADQSLRLLAAVLQKEPAAAEVDMPLAALSLATRELAAACEKELRQSFSQPSDTEPGKLREVRMGWNALADRFGELHRHTVAAQFAVYESIPALRLVPALDPDALDPQRDEKDALIPPWLSYQALRWGSDFLLRDYLRDEKNEEKKEARAALVAATKKARASLEAATAAYVNRQAADRPTAFAERMKTLSDSLSELGKAIEPIRREMPIRNRDPEMLDATAYPAPSDTWAEVFYDKLNPFLWSWIVNFAALACLSLAFGVARNILFWTGIVVLGAGQLLAVTGFTLRGLVSGWVPMTGMFETVVFTALVAAILGMWFALLPLIWPGLTAAWRLTAMPQTWEMSGQAPDSRSPTVLRAGLALLRIALGGFLFYLLAWKPYNAHHSIFALWPKTGAGASMPAANDLTTWFVGLCILLPTVWYTPRFVLAILMSPATVWRSLAHGDRKHVFAQVRSRQLYAIVGALMAFLVSLLGYYSPFWRQEIGGIQPVLKDQFWLTSHVLTITASYGAGALGWGLANISLCYYLFGRYRVPAQLPAEMAAKGHRPAGQYHAERLAPRPPEACSVLAGFIYRATQVAVVLLAVGTILGALWADVAWGRFWGWDAKEVWALVSLLVYMTILHGRYIGWFNHFALAAVALAGATAIIMAWFGVNIFLGTGLHTYAQSGDSSEWTFWGFAVLLCLNWLFLGVAGLRYWLETESGVFSTENTSG